MANLTTLLQQRYQNIDTSSLTEENLEDGVVTVYHPTSYNNFRCNFRYAAPGPGILQIEAWGAGGSTGKHCCCSMGTPGDSGAYTKKTVNVTAGAFVTGNVGISCGNSDTLCFKGCSEATCITICTGSTNGTCICLCAEGGVSGMIRCLNSGSAYCCLIAANQCFCQIGGSGCGIICNCQSGDGMGRAFGGDVNCPSVRGCTYFRVCNPCCNCCNIASVPIPAGVMSTCGMLINYTGEGTEGQRMQCAGNFGITGSQALRDASRDGVGGAWWMTCWSGNRVCSCYQTPGCANYFPYGMGAPPAMGAPSTSDHGWRGGHGAVRIKFIG